MDEKVKEYIEKQKSPQKEIIKRIRTIILDTFPDCDEKSAWGVISYRGNKFYLAAMKTRVHVGFAITGLSKEEIELFEGSGKTMRHIKIPTIDDIDEKQLKKLLTLVDKKAKCVHNC